MLSALEVSVPVSGRAIVNFVRDAPLCPENELASAMGSLRPGPPETKIGDLGDSSSYYSDLFDRQGD